MLHRLRNDKVDRSIRSMGINFLILTAVLPMLDLVPRGHSNPPEINRDASGESKMKGDGAAAAVPLVCDGEVEGSDWTDPLHSSFPQINRAGWHHWPRPGPVAIPLNDGTRHRATTCNRIETRPPADTSSLKI